MTFFKYLGVQCLMMIAGAVPHIHGQYTIVTSATVLTEDRIRFSVQVVEPRVRIGDSIKIKFEIENNSPLDVYVVREDPSRIQFEANEISIFAPLPPIGGHATTEFRLSRLARGKVAKGDLIVTRQNYGNGGVYPITTGFSFIREADVKNEWLKGKPIKETAAISLVTRTVDVGWVSVEVTEEN